MRSDRTLALRIAEIALMVGVGVAVVIQPTVGIALALGLMAVVVAIRAPAALGLAFLCWIPLRGIVMTSLGGASSGVGLAELCVTALLVAAALPHLRRIEWVWEPRWPWAAAAAFVLIAVLSAALNHSGWVQLSAGLRSYFQLPVTVLAVAALVDDAAHRAKLVTALVAVTALQIPVAAVQFLAHGGRPGPDDIVGTLGAGGANVLGLWMLVAVVAGVTAYLKHPQVWVLPLLAGWLGVMVLASSRASIWLLVPCLLLALSARAGRRAGMVNTRRLLLLVLVALVVVGLTGYYYANVRGRSIAVDLLSFSGLIQEQESIQPGAVPRLAYAAYSYDYVRQNAPVPLLGMGPASTASGAAAGLKTSGYLDYSTGLRLIAEGSAIGTVNSTFIPLPTQAIATAVEYGPLGLAAFGAFVIGIGVVFLRRAAGSLDPYIDWRHVAMWLLVMVPGTIYVNSWEGMSVLTLGFWQWWIMAAPPQSAGDLG